MEKKELLDKILDEYRKAYNEIVAGTLKAIPTKSGLTKSTFHVVKTRNWGVASETTRNDGREGDTTTPYRLGKLASHNLFTAEDFKNYNGEESLHNLIGYNNSDAKYIMIYLYDRVMKNVAKENINPEGIEEKVIREEGAKKIVEVNRYERDPALRDEVLKKTKNHNCEVCGFDFETVYGSIGKGFIHVHHKIPLYKIGESYQADVDKDFALVCPNCHAMLHRNREYPLSIENLREIIDERKS